MVWLAGCRAFRYSGGGTGANRSGNGSGSSDIEANELPADGKAPGSNLPKVSETCNVLVSRRQRACHRRAFVRMTLRLDSLCEHEISIG